MPNSGILIVAAIALSPANASLSPGQSMTFAGTGGSGAYAFTLESSPSGGTIDPESGIYTAGPVEDVDDVVTLKDDRGSETKATIHVLANPNDKVSAPAQTPTGVAPRSVNLAGGGGADNECDCGMVGAPGRGSGAMLVALAAGLALIVRRRRL